MADQTVVQVAPVALRALSVLLHVPNTSPAAPMPTERKSILLRLHAKPGREADVAQFLKDALPLAQDEPGTVRWYALQIDDTTFGVFDTFADDDGRQAHIDGLIADALKEKWEDLLSRPPEVNMVDLIAVK